VYVIEMNRDGQVCQLLTLDYPDLALKLNSIARLDGLPLSAVWLTEQIKNREDL
jgi:2-oxoglutarate ferredoxin oxidoreductase subunit alpha